MYICIYTYIYMYIFIYIYMKNQKRDPYFQRLTFMKLAHKLVKSRG